MTYARRLGGHRRRRTSRSQNLNCGGCFASVEETNHGGANDSFTLDVQRQHVGADRERHELHGGRASRAALTPILPAGDDRHAPGVRRRQHQRSQQPGLRGQFGGTQAVTNVRSLLAVTDARRARRASSARPTRAARSTTRAASITPTGNAIPVVDGAGPYTIPLRTPFALTGSATDADGDALLYSWEQNDRGGAAGTALLNNTKTNGPLFAMFPKSGQISRDATRCCTTRRARTT